MIITYSLSTAFETKNSLRGLLFGNNLRVILKEIERSFIIYKSRMFSASASESSESLGRTKGPSERMWRVNVAGESGPH